MKMISLPDTIELADGTRLKLAPLALNKNFITFVDLSTKTDTGPFDVVAALLDCLVDCIANGNKDLTAETIAPMRELIPLNFVMGILDEQLDE